MTPTIMLPTSTPNNRWLSASQRQENPVSDMGDSPTPAVSGRKGQPSQICFSGLTRARADVSGL